MTERQVPALHGGASSERGCSCGLAGRAGGATLPAVLLLLGLLVIRVGACRRDRDILD